MFLIEKEFRQIFRNKAIVGMMLVMPVMQLLILPLAADYEVKSINLVVVDNDHSDWSAKLTGDIIASGYFKLISYNQSYQNSLKYIEKDEADIILEIPANFERNLVREKSSSVFIAVNAINGIKANIGSSYLHKIIASFNEDVKPEITGINITFANWYNRDLNYHNFMVPGILAILITMVGGFMTALNIVKEKETGTIEQINVTPIRKHIFIIGKLLPFWILANIVFTLGLAVAWLIYGIKPVGSLMTLYIFIWVYLIEILGFGLLISTYSQTQQQAMFVMFFFMMIFILMGGLFTSIDSMPEWAKVIASVNPLSYIIQVFRMVVLKGSGINDIIPHIAVVLSSAVVLNVWAIANYRKTI